MDENSRVLLNVVISNQFAIDDQGRLVSDTLFYIHGILAVNLDYGKNRAVYERGLAIRDKLHSEFESACNDLNI